MWRLTRFSHPSGSRTRRLFRRDSTTLEQDGSDNVSRSQDQSPVRRKPLKNQEIEAILGDYFGEGPDDSAESDPEEDDNAALGDSIHVKLVSVNGLDGQHAFPGESLPAGCTPLPFDFRFTGITDDTDVDKTWLQIAARDLLKFALDYLLESDEDNPPAIIFLARDLGGTVVKQALQSASKDPRYKLIMENTIHLFFFGTLH